MKNAIKKEKEFFDVWINGDYLIRVERNSGKTWRAILNNANPTWKLVEEVTEVKKDSK